MTRSAYLSEDGLYRYILTRTWGTGGRVLVWVMLNPSTADATQDDPTVRLCMGWAQRLGFDGVRIVNLFALRATDPRELKIARDPVGPENDDAIREAVLDADMVLCAWGNHGSLLGRAESVKSMLQSWGDVTLHCLKVSKAGQPVHPLYQPYSLVPVVFGEEGQWDGSTTYCRQQGQI